MLSLISLAALYLELSAEFIAVMQVLVYAGAILVIFVFVIVLFQDAYQKINQVEAQSASQLLLVAGIAFALILFFLGAKLFPLPQFREALPEGFGSAQSIGQLLYLDFFFPFEAVILLFLTAIIGTLYIAKKES